jgi:hypothetical protein
MLEHTKGEKRGKEEGGEMAHVPGGGEKESFDAN